MLTASVRPSVCLSRRRIFDVTHQGAARDRPTSISVRVSRGRTFLFFVENLSEVACTRGCKVWTFWTVTQNWNCLHGWRLAGKWRLSFRSAIYSRSCVVYLYSRGRRSLRNKYLMTECVGICATCAKWTAFNACRMILKYSKDYQNYYWIFYILTFSGHRVQSVWKIGVLPARGPRQGHFNCITLNADDARMLTSDGKIALCRQT